MAARAPYKIREPGSLKEAVAELVVACGGQARAAELCRVSKSQIARYTDESDENALIGMPVDIVECLEAHCGHPVVTRYLATVQKRLLVDLSEWGATSESLANLVPHEKLAEVAERTGKLLADAARAIAHDKFDRKKAAQVRRECFETLWAVTRLLQSLPT